MKKLLLLITLLTTPAIALEGDYTLVNSSDNGTFNWNYSLWQGNISGKCYIRMTKGNRGFLSEVDCSDHGISSSTTIKDSTMTDLDSFIKDKCTEPRKGMNGKYYAQCEVDQDYLEKQEFLRLKSKFGEGE